MRLNVLLSLFAGAVAVACSSGSSSEERSPAGDPQSGEVTSTFEGQRVVSQRDATGAVRGQLFDRADLVATLTLDATGQGTLSRTGIAEADTVAMSSSASLEDVNRGFYGMWLGATRGDGATPLIWEESWGSASPRYCASRGYRDCASTCRIFSYRANPIGCSCYCY